MWRSASDPVRIWQLRAIGVWLVALGGIGALAAWPRTLGAERLESSQEALLVHGAPKVGVAESPLPLDMRVFQAAVWNPPKVPVPVRAAVEATPNPPPPPPAPPPGPMPVLLAIMQEDASDPASRAALLYDPAEDRILVARVGDRVLGRAVVSVERQHAELTGERGVVRLTLENAEGSR